MRALLLLLISCIVIGGCKKDESSDCSCENAQITWGYDFTFTIPKDTISVLAGENDTIPKGYIIQFIGPSGSWLSYSWFPSDGLTCTDCPNPIAAPEITTEYQLMVVDSNGNSQTYTSLIVVLGDTLAPYIVYIPNIFTPNGDGINDELLVYGQRFALFHLQIKDTYGNIVFETHDSNAGWDGTIRSNQYSDPVNCANFSCIVDVTFANGKTYHAEGVVTVYRSTTICPGNQNDCRFGTQFDPSGFNPGLSSGETFPC